MCFRWGFTVEMAEISRGKGRAGLEGVGGADEDGGVMGMEKGKRRGKWTADQISMLERSVGSHDE